MQIKIDQRGRKTVVDDEFIEEFFDYYASMERHFEPLPIPTRVMMSWMRPKLLDSGIITEETDYQEQYRVIRQFLPGRKRWNESKYGPQLEAYREKYRRIATFATHETLNLTGKLMRDIEQKLLKDAVLTVGDFVNVVKVHLASAHQIQSEERERRQEQLDVAKDEKKVSHQDVEESAKLLDLLKS